VVGGFGEAYDGCRRAQGGDALGELVGVVAPGAAGDEDQGSGQGAQLVVGGVLRADERGGRLLGGQAGELQPSRVDG